MVIFHSYVSLPEGNMHPPFPVAKNHPLSHGPRHWRWPLHKIQQLERSKGQQQPGNRSFHVEMAPETNGIWFTGKPDEDWEKELVVALQKKKSDAIRAFAYKENKQTN